MAGIIQWGAVGTQGLITSFPRTFGTALSTEIKCLWPVPRNCYLGNLRVLARLPSTGDIIATLTVRVNQGDSALRCILDVGQLVSGNGGRVLVSAGDLLSLSCRVSGTAGASYTDIFASAELTPIPFPGAAP